MFTNHHNANAVNMQKVKQRRLENVVSQHEIHFSKVELKQDQFVHQDLCLDKAIVQFTIDVSFTDWPSNKMKEQHIYWQISRAPLAK